MTTSPRRRRTRRPPTADRPDIEGLTWADQVVPTQVEWLWPGAIPSGSLVLLEGRKGAGKSTLLAAIAAHVTGGPPLPGLALQRPCRACWIAGEDAWAQTVAPRLLAAGADPQLIAAPRPLDQHGRPRRMVLPLDHPLLLQWVVGAQIALVIIDPLASVIDQGIDLRVEQQVRLALEPLQQMAGDHGVTVIAVRHLRKGSGGDVRDAGLGSAAIGNIARAVIRSDEHPYDPGRYTLAVVACNLGRRRPTEVYSIVDTGCGAPRIEWHGQCDMDADSIAEGRGSEADRDEWSEADRLLASLIGGGWCPASVVMAEAERAAVSPRTIRRAKARLRIPSRRIVTGTDARWEWGPPPGGWPPGLADEGGEGGHTRGRGHLDIVGGGDPPQTRRKPRGSRKVAKDATRTHIPPQGGEGGHDGTI